MRIPPPIDIFLLITILFGCNNQSENGSTPNTTSEPVSPSPTQASEITPIDKFAQAIDSLQNINYFISGKDSIATSKDPSDFVEMNGVLYCFENPFDKSDSGLVAYNKTDSVRKVHVAKNSYQHGPSANILQLNFADTISATKWFERLTECKTFQLIKMKPKTELWLQGKCVYFIQSYYDPSGKVLNQITTEFKRHIE